MEPADKCDEIMNALDYWVDMLGLQNWIISVHVDTPQKDMPMQGCRACVESTLEHRAACIHLLNAEDYGDRMEYYDQEVSMVHELLHIKNSLFEMAIDKDTIQFIDYHTQLSDIATLLVGLRRGGDALVGPAYLNRGEYKLKVSLPLK